MKSTYSISIACLAGLVVTVAGCGSDGNGGNANRSESTPDASAAGGTSGASGSGGVAGAGAHGGIGGSGGHASGGHPDRDASRDVPDGSSRVDGGERDAGPSESGSSDAGDGSVEHAPPCPISSSFPVGTYELQVVVSSDYSAYAGIGLVVDSTSWASGRGTLTISDAGAGSLIVSLSSNVIHTFAEEEQTFSYVNVVDKGDRLQISADCDAFSCPPDSSSISVTIDKRTGIVSLGFGESHVGPYPSTSGTDVSATGWPVCPATTSSPPTWVRPPPAPSTLGCTRSNTHIDYAEPSPPSPPQCLVDAGSSCANEVDGFVSMYCPP